MNNKVTIGVIFLLQLLLTLVYNYEIQFTVVYPVYSSQQYFQIQVVDVNAGSKTFPMTSDPIDNTTHSYTYQTTTLPTSANIQYKYIFYNVTETLTEGFYRSVASCRVSVITGDVYTIKNEFFNQSQLYLGLDEFPLFAANGNGNPPTYYDDNQVMTLSFYLTEVDYRFLFDPDNDGELYVRTNMSFISLTEHQYLPDIKIRRAGGISLEMFPYSYQVKMNDDYNLGGADRVFKLKAYPRDYEGKGAYIVSEKASADITYSLGAPINYVSYVRVFINNIYYGIYGMLEKVNEEFVDRRWPYVSKGLSMGTLYKTVKFEVLSGNAWAPETLDLIEEESSESDRCCPCFEANCPVTGLECDDPDEECDSMDCCYCSWESNGKLEVANVNCVNQQPFADFYPLGNSFLTQNSYEIQQWLYTSAYLKSLLAELAIMNADGYVYNQKNYYWYRNVVNGQFILILFDQDTCFTKDIVFEERLNIYNWTWEAGLTDGPFLGTLTQDPTLLNMYNDILTNFLMYLYRSDGAGALYQRMNTLAEFIQTYNPDRVDVPGKVYSFINYFIYPMSDYLREAMNITTLPSVNPVSTSTCDL